MIILPGSIVFDESGSKFQVVEFLGNGSFGNVYKINKVESNEIFALKTLLAPLSDETALKTFVNEGHLATNISHENVIKYFFFHDGSKYSDLPPYIIMEFANSGTLENLIKDKLNKNSMFDNTELIAYYHQLIDGMEVINEHLVHRDIKPDNILISGGKLKITDFGLSKIVEESTRKSTFKGFGCIQYMAPEGWKLDKNTLQMDIYSMGFVFYELATLRHPLEVNSRDIQDWRNAHLFQNAKIVNQFNTAISPILSQVVMGMIEKKNDNRFQNWKQIRQLLQKETVPETIHTSLVDTVLKKRIQQDSKQKAEELKREQKEKEIEEFRNLISFQLKSEIIEPIMSFAEEFNNKYKDGQITFQEKELEFTLIPPAGNRINFKINPILKEDFYRQRTVDDYGRRISLTKLELPELNNRKIMAWGYLKSSDGRGLNLVLLEKDEEVYGEWYMLINKVSALARPERERPTPFPFELDEIEEEIQCIRAMHIYDTDVRQLDINFVLGFIGEYI